MTPDESIRAVAAYLREIAPELPPRMVLRAVKAAIKAAIERRKRMD